MVKKYEFLVQTLSASHADVPLTAPHNPVGFLKSVFPFGTADLHKQEGNSSCTTDQYSSASMQLVIY
jgi:hypothetical protein